MKLIRGVLMLLQVVKDEAPHPLCVCLYICMCMGEGKYLKCVGMKWRACSCARVQMHKGLKQVDDSARTG